MLSCAASLSSMTVTQRCSSASDIRAGMRTTVRSPSRYAETVGRRRALLRTSIALATEPLGGWLVVLRCGVPALCSGSAGTPRRYPLHTAEVPTPGRFRADRPPPARFVRRILAACGQLSAPVARFGHAGLAGQPRPTVDAVTDRLPPANGDVQRRHTGACHESDRSACSSRSSRSSCSSVDARAQPRLSAGFNHWNSWKGLERLEQAERSDSWQAPVCLRSEHPRSPVEVGR